MATMESELFLEKAEESLAGAESEFANGRYNNTANRCYYACFQAAIAALVAAGVRARGREWGHAFVQAQFAGELIHRRKQYPAQLRDTLGRNLLLRQTADYGPGRVTQTEASRALRRTREFVAAIQARGGERR